MILRLWDEHYFFFHAGNLYLFYIFTVLVISDMYFGTEKSLYNCCQHIFKHLVSFVQCLVNFFSLGDFSSQNLEQSLGELEI